METAKRIIFLLALAVLVTIPVQSEEKQSKQISNTRTASCLVKITCDPEILPLDLKTLDYLLHSSGIGGRACSEVLGISPDQDYDLFTVEYVQTSASDDIGGIGMPPMGSQAGRSSIPEEGMNEYEYAMMMEAEMGLAMSAISEKSGSSPRVSRTRPTNPSVGAGIYDDNGLRSRGSRDRAGRTLRGGYGISEIPQRRTETATVAAASGDEQTHLFRLNVHLPEDVKPLAGELMSTLVDNLRQSLREAHNAYLNDLEDLLENAELRCHEARLQLQKAVDQVKAVGPAPEIKLNPVDIIVYEQLEQIVDLSNLETGLPFTRAIEILSKSVDPPLQIQPNWKDLLENAEVEQATPAGVDPLTGIKLRKALEILLDAVSSEFAELDYVVDEGIILIATPESLPGKMVPGVYDIPALAYSPGVAKELVETIQNTIDPESWFELNDSGEATITPYPSQRPKKLAILQTYENHQKIWEFLQNITIDIPAVAPPDIPVELLFSEKNNLLAEKQNLEMELARLQGRMPAIEAQIARMNLQIDEKVRADQVSEELRTILDLQVKHLEMVKRYAEQGRSQDAEIADAEEKIARAKIELARRREQIGVSAGTDQLTRFSNELATLVIEQAEKRAMLQIIDNQLNQTEQKLTAADIRDPQVSRMRMATQALDIAERRVNELNARLVNLQLPMVSVLGGD